MTLDERNAMDSAALTLRQIECLLTLLGDADEISGNPALADALAGIESLARRETETLSRFG